MSEAKVEPFSRNIVKDVQRTENTNHALIPLPPLYEILDSIKVVSLVTTRI